MPMGVAADAVAPVLPCDEQCVRCRVTIPKARVPAAAPERDDGLFNELLERKVSEAIGTKNEEPQRVVLHIVFSENEKRTARVLEHVTWSSKSCHLFKKRDAPSGGGRAGLVALKATFKRVEHPLRVRMSACARERDLRGYVHAANIFGAFRDNDYVLYVQRAFPDMSAFDIVHAFSVSGSSLPFLLIPEDEADQLPKWKKRAESALAQLRAPLTKSVSDISPFLGEFGKRAERPVLQLQRELARQPQPRTVFGKMEATTWPEGRVLCVLATPESNDAESNAGTECDAYFRRGDVPPDDLLERLSVRLSCARGAQGAAARDDELPSSTYIPKHCLPVPRLIATPDACLQQGGDAADSSSFSSDSCATLEIKMHSHSRRFEEHGDPERNLFVRMTRMQAWLQGVLHGHSRTGSVGQGEETVGQADAYAYYMIVGYRTGPVRTGRLHIASPSQHVTELQKWMHELLTPPSAGGDAVGAASKEMLDSYTASARWEPEMNVDTTRDSSVHPDAIQNLKRAMLRKHQVTSLDPVRSLGDTRSDMFAPFITKEGVTQIVFHASDSVPILCDLDRQRRRLRDVSTAVAEEAQCYVNTVALACDPISRATLNDTVPWMLDTARDGRGAHTSIVARSTVDESAEGVGGGKGGGGGGGGGGALSREGKVMRDPNIKNLTSSAIQAVPASTPRPATTAYDAYRYSLGL